MKVNVILVFLKWGTANEHEGHKCHNVLQTKKEERKGKRKTHLPEHVQVSVSLLELCTETYHAIACQRSSEAYQTWESRKSPRLSPSSFHHSQQRRGKRRLRRQQGQVVSAKWSIPKKKRIKNV